MVSIIILSYNTRELLESCLESVYKKIQGVEFEIIVVDNASEDDSVQMLKKKFKKVIIVENKKNLGFSRGNNIGSQKASGKYFLFLNSDTQLTDNGIEKTIERLDADDSIGIIGGRLKNADGTVEKSYGKYLNVYSVFSLLFLGSQERQSYVGDVIKEVDWVNGACMLIRKEIFQEVGGFDEHFFMYVEDMDLCLRVKKTGYRICVSNQAQVLHLGQGSSNRSFAIVHIYRGIVYFFKKHKTPFEYAIVRSMLILKAYFAIGLGRLRGNNYLVSTYSSALKF